MLNQKQQRVIEFIRKGYNVFITGSAGVGKGYTLDHFVQASEKIIGVTSTTGVSAINIGGVTIHSYLGLNRGDDTIEDLLTKIRKRKYLLKRYYDLEILIVDEISMLGRELFEKIDILFRTIRGNNVPFGGVQTVFSGDFLQLKPINDEFCFKSPIWDEVVQKTVVLTKVHRQSEERFVKALNDVRFGRPNDLFQTRLPNQIGDIRPTKLFSLNRNVDLINKLEIEKIDESCFSYVMKTSSNDDMYLKNIRMEKVLILKKGAQVMLLSNINFESGLVNGSRGVVEELDETNITVKFLNGEERLIRRVERDVKVEKRIVFRYEQFPLKLAYATTIHSTQGMTLDLLEVDLANVFACGQMYVALSRARNLEGLFITKLDWKKLKADEDAIRFYNSL